MMKSLQDQLLNAGLTNDQKAKKLRAEKRKNTKSERQSKNKNDDKQSSSVDQLVAKNRQRDKELNQQKQSEVERKALDATIKQLIEVNKVDREQGEVEYSFVHDKLVKKLYVTEALQIQLSKGRLAIVGYPRGDQFYYELVPTGVADKIAQRNDSYIVQVSESKNDAPDEDDPYADFVVPDDLTW